jgi:hypothetical protein
MGGQQLDKPLLTTIADRGAPGVTQVLQEFMEEVCIWREGTREGEAPSWVKGWGSESEVLAMSLIQAPYKHHPNAFPFLYPLFAALAATPGGPVEVVSLAAASAAAAGQEGPWSWCSVIASVPSVSAAQLLIAHLEGQLQAGHLEQEVGALRGRATNWFKSEMAAAAAASAAASASGAAAHARTHDVIPPGIWSAPWSGSEATGNLDMLGGAAVPFVLCDQPRRSSSCPPGTHEAGRLREPLIETMAAMPAVVTDATGGPCPGLSCGVCLVHERRSFHS